MSNHWDDMTQEEFDMEVALAFNAIPLTEASNLIEVFQGVFIKDQEGV